MAMRIDVRSRDGSEQLLGYLDLADNELPPETSELNLRAKPLGDETGEDQVRVPVTFRKATPDLGKWIAWADAPEDLDRAEGYSRAGSEAD
jgi:hypothetical protein